MEECAIEGSFEIKSIQANILYRVNNQKENDEKNYHLDMGKAVINDSIFNKYMRNHGVTVYKKRGTYRSKDFIMMKFDYKVDEEMTLKELRKFYYENGAEVTWNKYKKDRTVVSSETIMYKMLMRSPGKAKDGDCIFIRDNLYDVAIKYITMNLFDKMPNEGAKIVEMSAYCTLATATAIGYITIPWENVFVVKDEDVYASVRAYTVMTKNVEHKREKVDFNEQLENSINKMGLTFYKKKQKEHPEYKVIKKNKQDLLDNGVNEYPVKLEPYYVKEAYVERPEGKVKVKNTIWDGMGLIDDSIFPDDMNGFIYCRSHFFKSCLFRGSIQQFFKDHCEDYETAIGVDMFGNVKKLSDIKVIISENSIKWIKFAELMGDSLSEANQYYDKFMRKHGYEFEIVKTAHKSIYGDLQRSSYQVNNSLPCADKLVLERIAKSSCEYLNTLKTDHEAFMKYLKATGSSRYSINNVLIALDERNENFKYTKYFRDEKNDETSEFKMEKLKRGKLMQEGDNLTICGNPIAMLLKVMGLNFLNERCFETLENGIQCYTTRFNDGEKLAAFRNPHNAPNNIVHLINTYSEPLQKYFSNLSENVIIINGIGTDVQERLNSQDLDSDFVYTTNQPDMADLAEYAYIHFPTIVNGIGKDERKYEKTMGRYAEMDNRISANQSAIGQASNLAQLALSYYYENSCKSKELEDVFIICSVLAQVSIDESKRSFDIAVGSELNRIRQLECMKRPDGKRYPKFYADIQNYKRKKNGMDEIDEKLIKWFKCPMEILAEIIEKNVIDLRKHQELVPPIRPLGEVFQYKRDRNEDKKQKEKVISIVEEYDKDMKKLDKDDEGYVEHANRLIDACIYKLRNIRIRKPAMSALINYALDDKDGKCKIRNRLLVTLFDKDKETFLDCFIETKKVPQKVCNPTVYREFVNLPMREEYEKIVS